MLTWPPSKSAAPLQSREVNVPREVKLEGLISAQVKPPVLPDCACRKYPFVGLLLTFKFASSTTLFAIVVAISQSAEPLKLVSLAVTSPVKENYG